jgi:hypothetical protein
MSLFTPKKAKEDTAALEKKLRKAEEISNPAEKLLALVRLETETALEKNSYKKSGNIGFITGMSTLASMGGGILVLGSGAASIFTGGAALPGVFFGLKILGGGAVIASPGLTMAARGTTAVELFIETEKKIKSALRPLLELDVLKSICDAPEIQRATELSPDVQLRVTLLKAIETADKLEQKMQEAKNIENIAEKLSAYHSIHQKAFLLSLRLFYKAPIDFFPGIEKEARAIIARLDHLSRESQQHKMGLLRYKNLPAFAASPACLDTLQEVPELEALFEQAASKESVGALIEKFNGGQKYGAPLPKISPQIIDKSGRKPRL